MARRRFQHGSLPSLQDDSLPRRDLLLHVLQWQTTLPRLSNLCLGQHMRNASGRDFESRPRYVLGMEAL